MGEKKYVVPEYVTAEEIRRTRKELGLSQSQFAEMMGCSKATVVRWEASDTNITGPIVFAIYAMNSCSDLKEKIVLPKMKYPLRLCYMYKQQLCTLIDVDEMNEKLEIINYVDGVMFRAFGSNVNPTYTDYLEFIESRCFPRSRDKMKLILDDLGIPFYDPIMIIEKTMGKMAEDDFWIRLERR